MSSQPDYGIDAPSVQRNLFLGALAGLSVWAGVQAHLWSGRLQIPHLVVDFTGAGLVLGVVCLVMAVWMRWDSKIGKLRERDRMLDRIDWSGEEQVLDLGCGRGLMVIGAAKRLKTGKATGIDLWQTEDLSGNAIEATQANIQAEGVVDRVVIQTGDMRALPFADASFDLIVSRAAIHNVYDITERDRVVAEIVRVLKPGGQALINDIRHGTQYRQAFERLGCRVESFSAPVETLAAALLSFGSIKPVKLQAVKI